MDSDTNQASRSARRVAARQARDAFPPMGIYAIRDRASARALIYSSARAATYTLR